MTLNLFLQVFFPQSCSHLKGTWVVRSHGIKLYFRCIQVLHHDDALTCWLQVEMGLVHLHLKNLTSAKSKFQQVLMTSAFLELSRYEWYAVAVCKLEEIAKVEAAERERIFRYERAVHQVLILQTKCYRSKKLDCF